MSIFTRDAAARANKRLVERMPQRATVELTGGATVYGLVLGSTNETTTVVDLKSQAIVRWRIPWPSDYVTDLAVFDVVEGQLADDLERNDLAQPEAVTLVDLPRRLGTYRGRRVRRLARTGTPQSLADGPLFGFPGGPECAVLGVPGGTAERRPDRGRPRSATPSPTRRRLHVGSLRLVR